MIYVALLFLVCFAAFFIREIVTTMRRGFVTSRDWTAYRGSQPVRFWLGISAWTLNTTVAASFLFLLLRVLLKDQSS